MQRNRILENAQFCSMKCYQASKPGALKKCSECGKRFYVPRTRSETAHYCSIRCYRVVNRERIRKMGISHRGTHLSQAHRRKISERQRGQRHWNWCGGISKGRSKVWYTPEYQRWRRAVLKRDNYTCQQCRAKDAPLHVDHKKPFATHPKLITVVSNGRTLCVRCHRKTPTYGNPRRLQSTSA